ncbi:hypothetical protein [Streptomyces sp. MST-110588]|uniref:hypothetical protein n=1 Tax=Streptomyces sp. MST-110588 TaxID=2833628 RepID=UPI001F5C20F3|nr:hypothetical protein [Streptomyces sp. MST-110588]UNO41566.1 hypothetical protein KGS77_20900 [Streptomyces sp. MST-110588]
MSDIAGTPGTTSGTHPTTSTEPPAHEAYAFACMRCGYGWEQSYEIVHHVDAQGRTHCWYYADGERVPSPLTRPTCLNCGGNVVRIMRSGQVSMVSDAMANMYRRYPSGAAEARGGAGAGAVPQQGTDSSDGVGTAGVGKAGTGPASAGAARAADGTRERAGHHHWHLSDLLHPFQHHRK